MRIERKVMRTEGKKIMIVGPYKQKGVPLSTILTRRFGHEVYTVNCGRKAFQKMIAVDFDLIVVMDSLFDMSGYDFVKQLENREDRGKVVFFTGKWNVWELNRMASFGVYRYLSKPVCPRKLALVACGLFFNDANALHRDN